MPLPCSTLRNHGEAASSPNPPESRGVLLKTVPGGHLEAGSSPRMSDIIYFTLIQITSFTKNFKMVVTATLNSKHGALLSRSLGACSGHRPTKPAQHKENKIRMGPAAHQVGAGFTQETSEPLSILLSLARVLYGTAWLQVEDGSRHPPKWKQGLNQLQEKISCGKMQTLQDG